VLFVSCEMRPELLFDRTLAATAGVSVNRLAQRSLKALEWTNVELGLQQLAETPLYVLRRHYHTAEIRDALLRLEARNERPVLVLHRGKDADGGRRTVLWTLKRRNLGRPETDGPSELLWTGTRYADPHPAAYYEHLFEQYTAR